jgi:hypothetical protein
MSDVMKMRTALFALGIAMVAGGAHATTVVVDPSTMGSWAFDNRDVNGNIGANSTGVGQMVTGPGTPPLGVGSAQLSSGNGTSGGDGGEDLRTTFYDGVPLSQLTSLSYSTYATAWNGSQIPYLSIEISTTGVGPANANFRIFFEPAYQTPTSGNPSLPNQGSPILNTWQTWDALDGGWWNNNGDCNPGAGPNGVCSLATLEALYPDATIEPLANGLGGLALRVGYASPGDVFNGYVDNVTVGVAGQNTTYDFEPVPEPATLGLFGLGLVGLRAVRRRSGA